MTLTLRSSVTAMGPGLSTYFLASGGTAPYIYSVLPNGAGGSINSSTGVYTAPVILSSDAKKAYDTIVVTDSTSATASTQILIGNALLLFCDILKKELNLDDSHLFLWDQKIFQPTDSSLYIAVGVVNSKPFGNTNKFEGVTNSSIQSINMLDIISIDAISRGPSARDRRAEILMALNSNYAESQQELNSFYVGKLPSGGQFINLSEIDGAAIPYRFRISINLQYFVTKVQSVSYYDEFSPVEVTTDS